jgi:hypothetical protein
MKITFKIYENPDLVRTLICKAKRPRTSAQCERWHDHSDLMQDDTDIHMGRDHFGRWHTWHGENILDYYWGDING